MSLLLAFETRLDADWRERAWKAVLLDTRFPSTPTVFTGSLPFATWIAEPRDPVRGDLAALGATLAERAADIAAAADGERVRIHRRHADLDVVAALRALGVEVDLDDGARDGLDGDVWAVGGSAGRDMAAMAARDAGAAARTAAAGAGGAR